MMAKNGVYPAGTLHSAEEEADETWRRVNQELDMICQQNKAKKPGYKEKSVNRNSNLKLSTLKDVSDEMSPRIIMKEVWGHRFTFVQRGDPKASLMQIKEGSLIQPVTALDNQSIISHLKDLAKTERFIEPVYGRISDLIDTYVTLEKMDTIPLSRKSIQLLTPCTLEDRVNMVRDQERIAFLESLMDGQEVLYLNKEQNNMLKAKISRQFLKGDVLFLIVEVEGMQREIETTAGRIFKRIKVDFRKTDHQEETRLEVGDRVSWLRKEDDLQKATIRWLGHLSGHSSLYAGVEFDEKIGQGTGNFKGECLFKTRPGYAGFLLSSILSKLVNDRSNPGKEWPIEASSSHVHKTPRDNPSRGGEGSIGRSNSNHSSSDLLSYTSKPTAPKVPPRPQMNPEDFLIDNYAPGQCVEVAMDGMSRWGVIRWIGDHISREGGRLEKCAQVELETEAPLGWRLAIDVAEETMGDVLRTVFVASTNLRRDRRFDSTPSRPSNQSPSSSTLPGEYKLVDSRLECADSGIEVEYQSPTNQSENLIGKMKGIQGWKNSCYMDSTLYAIFAQSTAFDSMLTESRHSRKDSVECRTLRRILAQEIVYPLRKGHFVRSDHIMKFRECLAKVLPLTGLTSEEMDPEEILTGLFEKVFHVEPFIELISQDKTSSKTHLLQMLNVNMETGGGVTTTLHLLEKSMKESCMRFKYPPKVLCLQMPRYGKQKFYDRIVPFERIDITALVQDVIPCGRCEAVAEVFCATCFLTNRAFLGEASLCLGCFHEIHLSRDISNHVPGYYESSMCGGGRKPKRFLCRLRSVISIESSHYVAFVRSGDKFVFFDSMADRMGGVDGYNIPETVECPTIKPWLSVEGWKRTEALADYIKAGHKNVENDRLATRLMSDASICIYELEDYDSIQSEEPLISI